ncbi:MAG: endonuclease/exonuclease/phosphatase family protein [Patescibacteria group bacterium]
MKIISLNTYGGHVFEPLMKFIKEQSADTQVFCFQEMVSSQDPRAGTEDVGWRLDLFEQIQKILPDFKVNFVPTQENFKTKPEINGPSKIGNAIFYHKNLEITDQGDFYICHSYNSFNGKDYATLGHNTVWIKTENNDQPLIICCVHGNSEPADKLDSPMRIEQSKKILDFLKDHDCAKVIMGDFNLFPETESIKMFERSGFRNLITEYEIKNTRGSKMRQLFPEYEHGPYGFQNYADFTLVTPDLKIDSFEVPDVPISDHLPMILKLAI